MSRRIVLLVIAAALVWGGVYALSKRKDKPEPAAAHWPEIAGDSVTRIDIAGKGRSFSLFKRDGDWFAQVTGKSVEPRVQPDKVETLVEFISRHKPRRDLGEWSSAEAETYGLKPPSATLSLRSDSTVGVGLGGLNPSRDGVYATCTLAPNRLLLLDAQYLDHLKRPAEHYFDLRLIRGGEQEVRDFGVSSNGQAVWRIKQSNGGFGFLLPERLAGTPVSASQARFFLHNLLTMDAGALVLEPVNATLAPEFTVSANLEGGRKALVNVFKEQGGGAAARYLANSTWQPGYFLLSDERVSQLNKTTFDMRQRSIVTVDTAKVGGVTIVQNDKALGAFKNATGWYSKQSKKELLGIDMSLWRLTDLQFEAEPAAELPKTAELAMTWDLKDDKGDQVGRIIFYNDSTLPNGRCWLYIDGKKDYYPVSNQLLKDLLGQLP